MWVLHSSLFPFSDCLCLWLYRDGPEPMKTRDCDVWLTPFIILYIWQWMYPQPAALCGLKKKKKNCSSAWASGVRYLNSTIWNRFVHLWNGHGVSGSSNGHANGLTQPVSALQEYHHRWRRLVHEHGQPSLQPLPVGQRPLCRWVSAVVTLVKCGSCECHVTVSLVLDIGLTQEVSELVIGITIRNRTM